MIKLRFEKIETVFDISNENHYLLVIENQKFFRSLLETIFIRNQEEMYLFDEKKNYSLEKDILFLPNLLELNIDNKMNNSYYSLIQEEYLNNDKRDIINNISSLIIELLEQTKMDVSVPIDYDDCISYKNLLSLVKMKVVDNSNDLLERIVLYTKLQKEFYNYKLLIIPFLDSFLSSEEMIRLINDLRLMEVSLMVITNKDNGEFPFAKVIIDKELCEI